MARKKLFLFMMSLMFAIVRGMIQTKHNSKEVVDPDEIFLMSNDTLGDNGDSTVPYAVYQNANLAPGPYPQSYAVYFDPAESSFMELDNSDGDFDGPEAFTWGFYLSPADTVNSTERVIMTYKGVDGNESCELRQTGRSLLFKFRGYGIDNSTGLRTQTAYTFGDDILTTTNKIDLAASAWTYVIITYSTYNDFAAIVSVEGGLTTKVQNNFNPPISAGTHVFANAFGNIRFGNSFSGNEPFHGSIACITFKQMSLLGPSVAGLEPKCDPTAWTDTSILGRVKAYSPPTTTSMTSTTSSTPPATSESISTSTTMTSAFFSPVLTPNDRSHDHDVLERCQHFTLEQFNVTYLHPSDVLGLSWVQDLRECTSECSRINDCVTFVITPAPYGGFLCYSGVSTNDLKLSPGAKFYSLYGVQPSSTNSNSFY